jgi:integrase
VAVYKRQDRGKWQARIVGANGRAVAKLFDRKADAVRWEAEQLTARDRGDWIDPRDGRVTFAEFYADWSARQVWESTTTLAMNLAVRQATFGDVPIGRIRRSHIETWVKTMTSANLAPGTIKTRYNNARAVFRAAVRDRFIATDPTEGVTLPRQRRREHAMELPTPEQVRALLNAADDEFMPFLALCAFSGLRLGEAAGVQVGDIDFLRRQLHVRRQVQRTTKETGVELRPPKYGSERVVYLADDLVQILARQVEGCDVWLFEGQGNDPPHQLVTSNVPTARMVQVDQWQVDPHRKRGNALRSGSDAAAGLWRCIRCNNPAVDATKSDATSWHPMQRRMVISWSGA